MPIYSNPRGLYEFQSKLTAYSIYRPSNLLIADAGLGKSHIGLATAAVMIEDGTIDHSIFVVEGNKVDEWMEDFAEFTEFSLTKFHGPKRSLDLDKNVTLTTYHTFRDSLVEVDPADDRKLSDGEAIRALQGKRLLVVLDEAAVLAASRTSRLYRAYERALREWRRDAEVRVLAMTATPMSTSPENYFNLGRLLRPDLLMTVAEFNAWYVVEFNDWGKAKKFKNIDHLEQVMAPIILRKRKTDPDVIDQFPKVTERFSPVHLSKPHLAAYRDLDDYIKGLPDDEQLPGFNALNAFVQHPGTVLTSGWQALPEWLERYGVEKIEKLKSSKVEAIIDWAKEVRGSTGGHIIFSRSNNALVWLAKDMRTAGLDFVEFHGRRTDAQNRAAKAEFREGGATIMLASGKAERGINLPEAHYISMFDAPATHSSYLQRLSRGSRIGSNVGGTLTVKTFITQGTIEQATVNLWQRRNQWSDQIQDADINPEDDKFVTAIMRRAMIRSSQKEEKP